MVLETLTTLFKEKRKQEQYPLSEAKGKVSQQQTNTTRSWKQSESQMKPTYINNIWEFGHQVGIHSLKEALLLHAKCTWFCNNHPVRYSWIDRRFFSKEWEEHFPIAFLWPLRRVVCEHSPLLLATKPIDGGPALFRFKNIWISVRILFRCAELVAGM